MRGIIYIAVGRPSFGQMTTRSIASLRRAGCGLGVAVVTDDSAGAWRPSRETPGDVRVITVPAPPPGDAGDRYSRQLKTQLNRLTPFTQTLYLDCDTLILSPLDELWTTAADHELAMTLDRHHTIGAALDAAPREGRATPAEWSATRQQVNPSQPLFNGGILCWQRSPKTDELFTTWHEEWRRFATVDQFALARALIRSTLEPTTLPARFNLPSIDFVSAHDAMARGAAILHFYRDQQARLAKFATEREWDLHWLSAKGL